MERKSKFHLLITWAGEFNKLADRQKPKFLVTQKKAQIVRPKGCRVVFFAVLFNVIYPYFSFS